jgi:hypothetical protein
MIFKSKNIYCTKYTKPILLILSNALNNMITLRANSGIQFHTFDIILDANDEVPNR